MLPFLHLFGSLYFSQLMFFANLSHAIRRINHCLPRIDGFACCYRRFVVHVIRPFEIPLSSVCLQRLLNAVRVLLRLEKKVYEYYEAIDFIKEFKRDER